ncbi:MAG: Sua5/YciO/YrdC/YwlC family protein [Gammaproteobacteria bacterium]|nr:Sua5/YciO/YrdC/YwlC family protein [Gammaproteobacteria bacterium]
MANRWQVRHAANRLLDGAVLAYPTEAVWGLGCDPENEVATLRLLEIKERPVHKGLILVAGAVEQVEFLLGALTPAQRKKILATWPGPTTWLIPDEDDLVPWWVKGEHSSVAIRVTAHPLAAALSLAFGGPIVSTSANKAGQSPARTALKVIKQIGHEIDGLVYGRLGSERSPSRIVDLLSDTILR